MTTLKYIIAFSMLLLSTLSDAQTIRALERAGDEAMTSNDFHAAITHYGDILTAKDDRIDIEYKYGLAANSFNAFEIAEKSFKKVASSDIADAELKAELSNVNFWLGDTQKKLGKYEDAIISFKQFITATTTSTESLDQELVKIANQQIEDCEWATNQLLKVDNHYEITHLGDDVNTPYSEFAPLGSGDHLYFSTLRYEKERFTKNRLLSFSKIMKSQKGVLNTILLDSYDSSDKHIAHTAFDKNGTKAYFTVCGYNDDREIYCDLYTAEKSNKDKWTNIQKLEGAINQEGTTTTQPNIGYDGDQAYLYFVSNRIGGAGGDDIWRSKLNSDSTIGTPENLVTINTSGDDITPFFHSSTNTLYFSSNGRKNMGGFDVYSALITEDGAPSIEHFGVPLNSSYNDVYFTMSEDETLGHISSNRPESKYLVDSLASCCYDLYKIDFDTELSLFANLFDKESNEPIMVSRLAIEEVINKVSATDEQDGSNTYDVKVRRDRIYELTASAVGYAPATITVNTEDLGRNDDLSRDIKLKPLPIGLMATALEAASLASIAGVSYTLSIEEDGIWKEIKKLTVSDISAIELDLERNRKYRISATRDGYRDAFEDFNTYDMIGGTNRDVNILLSKLTPSEVLKLGLDEFLPVPLFFDNDQPRGGLNPLTTNQTYGELNDNYYARKPKFLSVNSAGLLGELRTIAAGDVEMFFDSEVRYAKESLNRFCQNLVEYLILGNTAEILVQGFASPLAEYEYNLNLGIRRTSSIENHISQWGNGALLPYINEGRLKITFKSYGEAEVKPGVSDNPSDIKKSIYGLDASRERRVEIIEVK